MAAPKIKLGDRVRCTLTELVGTATARCEYYKGTTQYLVEVLVDEKTGKVEANWINEGRLKVERDTK